MSRTRRRDPVLAAAPVIESRRGRVDKITFAGSPYLARLKDSHADVVPSNSIVLVRRIPAVSQSQPSPGTGNSCRISPLDGFEEQRCSSLTPRIRLSHVPRASNTSGPDLTGRANPEHGGELRLAGSELASFGPPKGLSARATACKAQSSTSASSISKSPAFSRSLDTGPKPFSPGKASLMVVHPHTSSGETARRSRLWNLTRSLWKRRGTVPVGPLRCLATMISAMFSG